MRALVILLFILYGTWSLAQSNSSPVSERVVTWDDEQNYETIQTDRPTFSYGTSILLPKAVQFEMGGGYSHDKIGQFETSTSTLNTTTIRYGLNRLVEARLNFGYQSILEDYAPLDYSHTQSGFNAPRLGAKVRLFENDRTTLAGVSLVTYISLNKLASSVFQTTHAAHNIITAWDIGRGKHGVTLNAGASWNGIDASTTALYSAVYSYNGGKNWNVFTEVYGSWAEGSDPDFGMDLGMLWRPFTRLQFDLIGGYGLSDSETDWFTSVGMSFRLIK